MKVKFLSGPKQGTIEHLQPHVCQPLIAAGICEHVPYKDFRERLAAETLSTTTPVVEWGVLDAEGPGSIVRVIKRASSNLTYYDSPPQDAPRAIVVRFNELANIAKNCRAANAAERARAQSEQEQEQLNELNRRY